MECRTIAIASGKGGTGKTTVAVNLAAVSTVSTTLLDCDVEEPNVHLFIDANWEQERSYSILAPHFDPARCQACGECRRVCRFNAIAVLPSGPLLFPELCHSCGGCVLACPNSAISEVPREIGTICPGSWGRVNVIKGGLYVSEAKSPPLIEAVRQAAPAAELTIVDSPPGTSCPVVAALRDVDYVVLVTEPTPFGLHDLRLAVQMTCRLQLPFGVVVNRAGLGDGACADFCKEQHIDVLAEIPHDRNIAQAYSRGDTIVNQMPSYRVLFLRMLSRIKQAADNAKHSRTQRWISMPPVEVGS